MANANVPTGLIPLRHRNGAPYNGSGRVYYVPSSYGTGIFVGDPVIVVTNSADASGIQAVNVAAAAGGAFITGVCVGVCNGPNGEIPVTRDLPVYHPASTAGYIMVCDDPEMLFEAQEDGLGGAMGTGAVGRNVDLIAGTGSTTTGRSGWMLDSSTIQTTSTLQCRILEAVRRPDNDPTLTLAKWLVSINNHALTRLTGV